MKLKDFILITLAIVLGVGIVAAIAYELGRNAVQKQLQGSSILGLVAGLLSPAPAPATAS